MDLLTDICWHDAYLLDVREITADDVLVWTIRECEALAEDLIDVSFSLVHRYQVDEGPVSGSPTILSVESSLVERENIGMQRIVFQTTAGTRAIECRECSFVRRPSTPVT